MSCSPNSRSFWENIIGQIPRTVQRPNWRTGADPADDTRHAFLDGLRNLRSSLLFSTRNGESRRGSPRDQLDSQRRKSLTTANSPSNMANAGSACCWSIRICRKGTLHARFNIASQPASTRCWQVKRTRPMPVKPSGNRKSRVLPRGASTQPIERLLLIRAPKNSSRSRAQYDYVLLDTPPVMAAEDVSSLAHWSEGVIFVIRPSTLGSSGSSRPQHPLPTPSRVLESSSTPSAPRRRILLLPVQDYYKSYPTAKPRKNIDAWVVPRPMRREDTQDQQSPHAEVEQNATRQENGDRATCRRKTRASRSPDNAEIVVEGNHDACDRTAPANSTHGPCSTSAFKSRFPKNPASGGMPPARPWPCQGRGEQRRAVLSRQATQVLRAPRASPG